MFTIKLEHKHADFSAISSTNLRQTPISSLHALLIGIDTYKNYRHLSGAVNDMESIRNFLCSDLSVPESQITRLQNEQATRPGIINAIQQLGKNPNIKRFDPILIYYVGHGCEIDSPLANFKEKAQCLVPWDLGERGADGQFVSAIPDYTISALLSELATKKGNNITVIFDSCHSASGTRGIWSMPPKAKPISSPEFTPEKIVATSCVVDNPGGALTSNYRPRSLNSGDLPPLTLETDSEIIHGARNRRRWRIVIVSVLSHIHLTHMTTTPELNLARTQVIAIQPPELLRSSRSHVLLAACGHSEQAYECTKCNCGYFTATLLQVLRSRRLGKLKYKRCFEEFPRLLTPNPQDPVCEGDAAGQVFFAIRESSTPERSASFSMRRFTITEEYFIKLGDAQGVIPGSKVRRILTSMAKWQWHNSREPKDSRGPRIKAVMHIYELGEADRRPLPVEEDGSFKVQVSPTILYGLQVESLVNRPLYPYLFYFSTKRQSIRPLYLRVYGSGHIDPPLEGNGQLTIGFNNDDMITGALCFALPEDEGYFRLFLTTSSEDFDSIDQPSPFTESWVYRTMPATYDNEYGDGLEIRRYHPWCSNEAVPVGVPTTAYGTVEEYSNEIVTTGVSDINVSERQQTDTSGILEHSIRTLVPQMGGSQFES
ncbi:hypothetical protein OPQ81_000514 [Rhizoctonia solani]|nr:hypothetical protein OPQ81_000514 [Rhizoctonia solani]